MINRREKAMTVIDMNAAHVTDQVAKLVAENRRYRVKSEADDKTIHLLKEQYDALQSGVENMIEEHRANERALAAERDRAVRSYTEIEGHLHQAADLIVQAMRARVGNADPAPDRVGAADPGGPMSHQLADSRMPQVLLS
jgi:folate-dependent tRNA-U54 methylase TrmFO/GidA